jgi:hypothetical protein
LTEKIDQEIVVKDFIKEKQSSIEQLEYLYEEMKLTLQQEID